MISLYSHDSNVDQYFILSRTMGSMFAHLLAVLNILCLLRILGIDSPTLLYTRKPKKQ